MSHKPIEERLDALQPSPSPRFHRRMSRAAWTPAGIARRRAFAVTGLTVLLAAALLVFTPQGRAWAQEVVHFFNRAAGDTVPVTRLSGTATPEPGYAFVDPIADVEQQAGFDVLEPAWLPVDASGGQVLSFEGASIEPDTKIVRIFYRFTLAGEGMTDGLVVREQRFQTVAQCELCGMVGASAVIETVQIGDASGEYVEGVWKADDTGVWKWMPDPYVRTLRWQKGDLALELQYFGLDVGKADLIGIANSMK
jgi:hypothetical protein